MDLGEKRRLLDKYVRHVNEANAKHDMDALEIAASNVAQWARKCHGGETTLMKHEQHAAAVRKAEAAEIRRLSSRLRGRTGT